MVSLHFNPPIIAHRGASAYAPENTLAAFMKAKTLGMKWIEFDVMQAACGEPIIFHDESLRRTTNGRGRVINFPYEYLKTLDAGVWFDNLFLDERIPTFKQTIDFIEKNNMSANIEIKALPGYEELLIKRVLTEIPSHLINNQTQTQILFSSFSIKALEYLRTYSKECQLGLLLHRWSRHWPSICDNLDCASVHVNQRILTEKTARRIKEMNRILLSYTVNSPQLALKLYGWGVDAVFSDVPDQIYNYLHLQP